MPTPDLIARVVYHGACNRAIQAKHGQDVVTHQREGGGGRFDEQELDAMPRAMAAGVTPWFFVEAVLSRRAKLARRAQGAA